MTDAAELTDEQFYEQLQTFVGLEVGPPKPGPDEVNAPMIRHLVETLGDTNPIYVDEAAGAASIHGHLVAPPTMLQAWVMTGIEGPSRGGDGPYERMNELLFSRGFTSVVATNSEQTYLRYLRPGDRITMKVVIDSISPQKHTGLGTGHFVTTRQDYYDADGELVGQMLFRIIRFKPAAKQPAPAKRPPRPGPALTRDNAFWFEAIEDGRLVIQRCAECSTLRNPPGPMCPRCNSLRWDTVDATGTGRIHSFVVVHYPQVPSFEYPLPVALVDLTGPGEDGIRMIMNTAGVAHDQIRIGQDVTIEIRQADETMKLPFAVIAEAGA
mgnify:FL=1|jgi:uncharacterized OB-fold protein/acyl dehydratase